jgi:hypothetical protein
MMLKSLFFLASVSSLSLLFERQSIPLVEVENRCGAGECFFAAWLALRPFAFWCEGRGLFSMKV